MTKLFISLILIALTVHGRTQPKYEREIRIKEKEVPVSALSFIDSINFKKKVKWYRETGYEKTSYEAKTKSNKKRYSIEFSQDGTFEDIEIGIKRNKIPENVHSKITDFFRSEYNKYSIEKTQIQYSGNRNLVLENFRKMGGTEGIKVHYEIVISTKPEDSYVMYEYLFSETGDFVKRSQIVLKNTDNLLY